MTSTTLSEGTPTLTRNTGESLPACPPEFLARYNEIVNDERLSWTTQHRMRSLLGAGGQGVVYLSDRHGTDGFTLPVALKVFSPQHYRDVANYDEDMRRQAIIAAQVAQIQHDNLLDVHNFVERNRIRIMEMEWVDGYDLRRLLSNSMIERTRGHASEAQWEYVSRVIFSPGEHQPRLKPGPAIQIIRECLGALTAMHRAGILHGDLKPSNIMLKRTGAAKIVDIGSALPINQPIARRMCSPAYAAPEVLRGEDTTPQSDLASLGYVMIEMLAGRAPFADKHSYYELLNAKANLPALLPRMLPAEVVCNELLLNFCRRMVHPDPARRFPSAEAAAFDRDGASSFHRQLVKGDLASEYGNDIRVWLKVLE